MNQPTSLSITPKGLDEVNNRTHKLSIRKRSILILLKNPQSIEFIFEKVVFPRHEVLEAIHELAHEGFVVLSGDAMPQNTAPHTANKDVFHLENGIILSEAKFLLVDFCVDGFGTQSQEFVDKLGACKNENALKTCLLEIYAATRNFCPDRIPLLQKLIAEINATA